MIMPKKVQQQMISELIELYKEGARQADNRIDQAIMKTFGTSLVKALEETQILDVDAIAWTDALKKEFVGKVLVYTRQCLDEITSTWTPDWKQILLDNYDNREDYVHQMIDYMQIKVAEAQPLQLNIIEAQPTIH